MSDPVRWRDELAADDERRALLLSHRAVTPTAKQADQIWSGLQSQLDLAPGAPPVPAGPAAAAASAVATKVTLTVALLAAVGTGVELHRIHSRDRGHVTRPASARPLPSPPSPVALPSTSPVALPSTSPVALPSTSPAPSTADLLVPLRLPDGTRKARTTRARPALGPAPSIAAPASRDLAPAANGSEVEAVTRPEPSAASATANVDVVDVPWSLPSPSPAQPIPVNVLLEESRRLERARTALRSNDPDGALRWLAAGHTRALVQEREALTIEAMNAKPGLRAAAAERAEAFLRTYPESPYRAHVKAIAGGRK